MEILAGDIRDAERVRQGVAGCEYVFHLASLIAIPYSYDAPRSYVDTNVIGALNVLQACRESTMLTRLVHVSTSEVYGTAQQVPIAETHPLVGQSPYSAQQDRRRQDGRKLPPVVRPAGGDRAPVQHVRPAADRARRHPDHRQPAAGRRPQTRSSARCTPTRDFNFVTDTAARHDGAGAVRAGRGPRGEHRLRRGMVDRPDRRSAVRDHRPPRGDRRTTRVDPPGQQRGQPPAGRQPQIRAADRLAAAGAVPRTGWSARSTGSAPTCITSIRTSTRGERISSARRARACAVRRARASRLATQAPIERAGFYVADSLAYGPLAESSAPDFESEGHLLLKEWEVTAARSGQARSRPASRDYERELGGRAGLFGAIVADRRLFMGPDCTYTQDYRRRFSDDELLCILQRGLEAGGTLFDELTTRARGDSSA